MGLEIAIAGWRRIGSRIAEGDNGDTPRETYSPAPRKT